MEKPVNIKQELPCFRKRPPQRLVTPEGYPYILVVAVAGVLVGLLRGWVESFPFWGLVFYIATFFRNPTRKIPKGNDLILAPADGKILEVKECEEARYLQARAKRVSIFMSPLNCHINRSPIEGKVLDCFYREGSFKAAFKSKAMEHNEHHALLLEDQQGSQWLVVQIAGFLARRIVSYVQGGFFLNQGERFGLIQFGSRTDLYCPKDCHIVVKPGQRVYAGKTILGRIP